MSDTVPVRLKVNGEDQELAVDPRTTLLGLLRDRLALVGTKTGCNQGTCGACTVQVDSRRTPPRESRSPASRPRTRRGSCRRDATPTERRRNPPCPRRPPGRSAALPP
ncbi:2Fe-2S iron-sulfur cluster-binding protein [Amycolatopsis sp. NPDC049868]|uniref:2Fe-2S iron-sulfur cluster-binding protein n=1 Tax=Amycolatopsis sp. NPDC049868 TaxID=3363934 RepID=UPI0037A5C336